MQLIIHTDGGARGNPGPAGIGIVVETTEGQTLYSHKAFLGTKTNNEAEYEALLHSVEWLSRFCKTTKVNNCLFLLDSLLVVSQIKGEWKIKEPRLLPYREKILTLLADTQVTWQIKHVLRGKNAEADTLVNTALDEALSPTSA